MKLISKYLKCGNIYSSYNSGYRCCTVTVVKYSDNTNLIIPFFEKYPVIRVKQKDFLAWCKVAKIMNDRSHLTNEGLNLIKTIKSGMNRERSKK
jgi:LAGLIDADG endonuclease